MKWWHKLNGSITLKDGASLYVHDDHIGRKITRSGDYYERDLLLEIGRHVRCGTFVDVGANIGNHSVYFARHLAQRVIAFEPNYANYRLLEKNTKGLNVVAFRMGCSDYFGTAAVTECAENMGMCELTQNGPHTVTVVRLDQFLHEPVSLIKIDAEGSTKSALLGAMGLIERYRPVIVIEGGAEINGYETAWSGCATRTDILIWK